MQPSQIGSYPILRLLGEGATGRVYAGHDPDLRREVAIKVLKQGVSPSTAQRFVREGRLLARLRHPGIVGVHGVGSHEGQPYLVMDLLVGESLEARLGQHGPYTWGEAVELASAVSDALSYAHRLGVVHRDLKPENVVLDAEGRPILTDFGLGKALDTTTQVSIEGALLGTPAYWAPEQARGDLDAIGPATDVYGVGAILYALLTGQGPNRGGSLAELVTSMEKLPPPPSQEAAGALPAELDAVCLRALARAPGQRFGSVAELKEALAQLTRPAPRGAKAPWVLAALASCAALGLGLAPARVEPRPAVTPRGTPGASPSPERSPPGASPATSPSEAPLSADEAAVLESRLRAALASAPPEVNLARAEELVRRAPERIFGHVVRAQLLTQQGRSAEAFANYVAAGRALPEHPNLELGLVGAGSRLDSDLLARLARLEQIKDSKFRAGVLLTRAFLYHSRGAYYLAIQDYRACLELRPKDIALLERHALALFDAQEFEALRARLPLLRARTRAGYLFVLGEEEEGKRLLSQARDTESMLLSAAAGGPQLPIKVPAGVPPEKAALLRYLSDQIGVSEVLEAQGTDPRARSEAHFYVGFDGLSRGDLALAGQHLSAAQECFLEPSFERSLARWFGDLIRPDASPFDARPPTMGGHLGVIDEIDRDGGLAPSRIGFETDLLLRLYPGDLKLIGLNARVGWGPRKGVALSRLARAVASSAGEVRREASLRLGLHQMVLHQFGGAERSLERYLAGQGGNRTLALGLRGRARLGLRKIPESIADLEQACGSPGRARERLQGSLAMALLLARRDEEALRIFRSEARSRPKVGKHVMNLLLAGWAVGREAIWRAQLSSLPPGVEREIWAHALQVGPPPAAPQAAAWETFVTGRAGWVEAGLPLRAPAGPSLRVVAGVYFATRGQVGRAREQFRAALADPAQRAEVHVVAASRWLADHPE